MNVLVVHRTRLFADTLARHLRSAPGIGHVGLAHGADQVASELGRRHYDVVLLTEMYLPFLGTLCRERTRRITTVIGAPGFTPGLLAEAEHMCTDGIVSLDQSAEDLARELGDVAAATRRLRTTESGQGPGRSPMPVISYHDEVDVQIVSLVATGLCDKEIAARIHLSSQTVRNRISRLLRDSHIANRTHLAAVHLRHEILTRFS